MHRWKFGRWPNLAEPATLNEKLLWKKLYGYRPLHATVTDKYAVRDWVAARIGPDCLIPLIGVFDAPDDLDLGRLPDSFVVKTTHASGQVAIVCDKHSLDQEPFKAKLCAWMKQDYYHLSKERQYKDIQPRLIVEKLLTDAKGDIPMDFKFHCFHGQVELIQVDIDRFADHRRNLYDLDWSLLPFTWSAWDRHGPKWPNGRPVERPAQLDRMITIATALAGEFDYVRVDLYNPDDRVYFGELTLHHGGGWERFHPPSWDLYFGNKLDLARA
jgi:hypothetical protein